MKKLKILFLLSFALIAIAANSQNTQSYSKVTMVQYGEYDDQTEQWDWIKSVDIDLTITLSKTNVYINDQAHTHLKCFGDSNESDGYNKEGDYYKMSVWDAYDEKGKKCWFGMIYYKAKKLVVYTITYGKIGFRYYSWDNDINYD